MTLLVLVLGAAVSVLLLHGRAMNRRLKELRLELRSVRITAEAAAPRYRMIALQDAVDNLEQSDQAHTNLQIMHAAQMAKLQADLAKMRLDPYFGYRVKEN